MLRLLLVKHARRNLQSSTIYSRFTSSLALTDKFKSRHIGPNEADTAKMLSAVGVDSLGTLLEQTVPSEIRLESSLNLPSPLSESEALGKLRQIASQNKVYKSFIGMGYNEVLTPAVIQRNVLENPGWYTAYTPYQAEVSQGRLESLLNFQTMVSDLTGLPMANASLLDEGTAAAEAMGLAHGMYSGRRSKFFVASDCHPQTISVVQTRAEGFGIELVVGNLEKIGSLKDYSGVLVQYPNTYGHLSDPNTLQNLASECKASKTLLVTATDLMALTLLKSPGELGADIAVGSAQRFGVPMMFGGPHAGFMATAAKLQRKTPGRIIGVSVDSQGDPALRMAMQTREQHIRRDKATSNICTAQALLANIAASYGVYHGPTGLKAIASRIHSLANLFESSVEDHGFAVLNKKSGYFDTLDIDVSNSKFSPSEIQSRTVERQMNIRVIDSTRVGVSFGEAITENDVEVLLEAFGIEKASSSSSSENSIPKNLQRKSSYMTHPVFNTHHSETQMLRYLKSLEDKDLSLNTSMIALGSCTMKLNATSELLPVTWPEFMNIHPFVPRDQCRGYLEMIESLHASLAEITGFAAISSQPNSGAQGEYAGLMAIRAYHVSRGEGHRNICLIPKSAHGTNPASAVMAGMKVVVVQNDEEGNIDHEDLKNKIEAHKSNLGALMITYPSTYGVFEEGVTDICEKVHQAGGQVYMDGANMNAQVGLTNPMKIGGDVCHLNLHKTFCIPHGGGGPGVGTIGVASHLAPFLPGNPVLPVGGEGKDIVAKTDKAINSAPYGSAGILPISWMYIQMLGTSGLEAATSYAILNANYMAKRLQDAYPIVFLGKTGRCAHEFIIDVRPFKNVGIVEEDIAKRLQDYGFHSPTMSWPVSGTLMIEPTESEDLSEMDRLCDALVQIREEIRDVQNQKYSDVSQSPLKNAPHTVGMVSSSSWNYEYSREDAAFPAPWQRTGGKNAKRFWPSVGRIDNVHGDRNLICTCPPIEDYE